MHRCKRAGLRLALVLLAGLVSGLRPAAAEPLAAVETSQVPEALRPLGALLGKPAPDFELTAPDGTPVTLAEARKGNRVVVVQLWAVWCTPCHIEALIFKQMLLSFTDKNLMVVGLHADDPSAEGIEPMRARLGMDYPVAVAPSAIWHAYGDTPVLPTTVIIGRSGRVRQVDLGVRWVHEIEPMLRALTEETVEEAREAPVTEQDFHWGRPPGRADVPPKSEATRRPA